ncbi:auxilin-like clathrin-binding protein required for normal clathrin function [Dipsacomyces acuminosporus]|nr:auxilin-like clathrin-binding protein required for normal clathrin function [Dipsacomyces acuminosporus]
MDDLLGVDWSKQQQQKKQGASPAASSSPLRMGSVTPNYAPNLSALNYTSAQSRASTPHGNSQQQQQHQKDDPFGELVSFSGASSSVAQGKSKMTLRERQQLLQEQSRSSSPFSSQQSFSASSSQMSGSGSRSTVSAAAKAGSDLWNFDALERASTPVQQKQSSYAAKDGAMDFDPLSASTSTQPSRNKSSGLSNSFDAFSGFASSTTTATTTTANPTKNNAGVNVLDDDEPIPMDINPPPAQQKPYVDHDFEIAQVVEYGFSADQARSTLEIAGNTRAAIQLLREQQSAERRIHAHDSANEHARRPNAGAGNRPQHTSYRDAPEGSSDEDGGFYYDNPRDKHNRGRGSKLAGGQSQSQHNVFGSIGGADSIIATANEIGSSVWKQANSWFAMGKKKINEMQESIQDQRKAKWAEDLRNHDWSKSSNSSSQRYRDYSDSSDEDVYVSANRRGRQQPRQASPPPLPPKHQQSAPNLGSRMASSQADSIIDLDGGFSSTPSAPKPRQYQPQQQLRQQSSFHGSASSSSRATPQSASSSPAAIPSMPLHILQGLSAAKASANEQFKLGQFGEAIAGYSTVIDRAAQHSSIHPILILLYNNRALAYARNGESKNASSDCTQSLELCLRYQANRTVVLDTSESIDIEEQRGKSLQRRAEAFEAGEKYREALADWRALREIARDATTRQQSARGIQRCEKALGINQPAKKPVAKKPAEEKPEDIANVFASISLSTVKSTGGFLNSHTENSAAVAEMRKQEQAKREEDDKRFAMLDQVELEIKQWKEGKQQNIRALLSSLHTLLPDVKPIGMHEILEANKVKRAYMRAIAKLHPDKLNKDTDVRTKMISANVFSTLNEAWDAFKAQEGIS